jgi:hypothetical protein
MLTNLSKIYYSIFGSKFCSKFCSRKNFVPNIVSLRVVTILLLLIIGKLLFLSCGNPEIIRKLEPQNPSQIKVIEKNKEFSINNQDLLISLKILDSEEILQISSDKNYSFSYDYSYRIPQIMLFQVKVKNKSRSRVYFNPLDLYFQGDYTPKEQLKVFSKREYEKFFQSQSYNRFAYDMMYGGKKKVDSAKKIKEEKKHPLLNYIIQPNQQKTHLCPFPRFSEKAFTYALVIPYRLVTGKQDLQKMEIMFNYIINREK